jgi:hypothetical protein
LALTTNWRLRTMASCPMSGTCAATVGKMRTPLLHVDGWLFPLDYRSVCVCWQFRPNCYALLPVGELATTSRCSSKQVMYASGA